MLPQDFPLILSLILSAIALFTVILALSGNKHAKFAGAITALGFAIGIVLLVTEGLGYFGSVSVPGPNVMLSTDWVSLLFGVAVLSASLLVGLTAAGYLKGSPNVAAFYSLLTFTTI